MQIKQFKAEQQYVSSLEAVNAWLNGDFGIGDELALISAIRQDKRVPASLSDDVIIDVLCDAMDDNLTAQECLKRLIA